MAVKKKKRRSRWQTGRLHWPGRHHHGHEDAEDAERLKPLEETEEFRASHQTEGKPGAADDTIRIDSASVPMPEQLIGEDREGASIFRLEPVVVCILLAMLAFMAFVAWQITLMPAK